MDIDETSIQNELNHILESRCFRSRKTLRHFLSYIVQESIAGRQEHINQYAIAIKGLGKPANFNAQESPLVRVQAGRLRAQLEEYYTTEGRFNALRITLPPRSYQPAFTHHGNAPSCLPAIPEEIPQSQSQGPGIICIPRNFVADETIGWPFINRLTRDYVNALTHFNYCQVMFADEPLWHQTRQPAEAWLQYGADFALFFDLYEDEQGYNLKCSLVHSLNRQIVWAHAFILGNTYPNAAAFQHVFKRIAHDTVGVEKGIALDYWVRHLLDSGKPIPPHQQIIVTMRQYCWDISPDTFRAAVRSCEQRLTQFPDDIPALILFADYCRGEYILKYGEIGALNARTAQTAETLLKLAPGNAYSHLFYAMSCLFEEKYEACEAAIAQSQAINPLDSHLNNLTGLLYNALGQWEKGVALIQDSIAISPIYPDWYHIALCFYHYREGRYLTAMQEAKKIKLKRLWGPMLRAALYQHTGWQEKSQQEYQQLVNECPNLAQDSSKLTQGFPRKLNKLLHQVLTQLPGRHPDNPR
ncbi:MAG: hypothetical protein KJ914_13020 [Gammaproteobacteria bacterium]|nr:hypothetical protein [Gammaproteobacteria bacterium]MBU1724851.1 hypothetical protein [Gammaproteobacteria bacterium]MBU2005035.1 hypothetical protein [Gammaproteobacteria bacterium]